MGKSLMRLPMFAESINKSHQILKSKGVDLIRIVTGNDPKTFDNILNSFVGIAAIQVIFINIITTFILRTFDKILNHPITDRFSRHFTRTRNSSRWNRWSFGRRARLCLRGWMFDCRTNDNGCVLSWSGFVGDGIHSRFHDVYR